MKRYIAMNVLNATTSEGYASRLLVKAVEWCQRCPSRALTGSK